MTKTKWMILCGALGLSLTPLAYGHTACDSQCEEDAVALFEECLANLSPDATDADRDACEDEARAFRDTCRASSSNASLEKPIPAECGEQEGVE